MNIRKNAMPYVVASLLTTSSSSALLADTSVHGSLNSGELIDTVATSLENRTPEIVELLPEDFKPAFTRDTMIELNAIVKRSYAAVEGFDSLRRELSSATKPNERPSSTTLDDKHRVAMNALKLHSQFALNDMRNVVEELRISDEYYNVAVLAGMVMFVEMVDWEIKSFITSIDS